MGVDRSISSLFLSLECCWNPSLPPLLALRTLPAPHIMLQSLCTHCKTYSFGWVIVTMKSLINSWNCAADTELRSYYLCLRGRESICLSLGQSTGQHRLPRIYTINFNSKINGCQTSPFFVVLKNLRPCNKNMSTYSV